MVIWKHGCLVVRLHRCPNVFGYNVSSYASNLVDEPPLNNCKHSPTLSHSHWQGLCTAPPADKWLSPRLTRQTACCHSGQSPSLRRPPARRRSRCSLHTPLHGCIFESEKENVRTRIEDTNVIKLFNFLLKTQNEHTQPFFWRARWVLLITMRTLRDSVHLATSRPAPLRAGGQEPSLAAPDTAPPHPGLRSSRAKQGFVSRSALFYCELFFIR